MSLNMKPLFLAQKKIQLQRHKQRIKTIGYQQRPKNHFNKKHSEFLKMRLRSSQHKLQKNLDKLNYQNNKLLKKLIQISNKKNNSIDSLSNKIQQRIQKFKNPFRKKLSIQIQQQNSVLGSRLINRKSDLSQLNSSKNIKQYIKLRNSMQKNKKIQIDNLNLLYDKTNKKSLAYSRVTQKSKVLFKQLQNPQENNDKAKLKTQASTINIQYHTNQNNENNLNKQQRSQLL